MTEEELNAYVKSCMLYPDGFIRDTTGEVVGGIDVDSDMYNKLFKDNEVVGFSIKGENNNK